MVSLQFTDDPNIRNMIGAKEGDGVAAVHEDNRLTGYCHFSLLGDTVVFKDLRHESGDMDIADGLIRLVAASHPECTNALCESRGLLGAYCERAGIAAGEHVPAKSLLETNCRD